MAVKKPKKEKEDIICGIYIIHNKIDDKYYVGSSNNVKNRLMTHKRDLMRNSHNVRTLQNDFNKHGEENFEFKIIDKNIEEEMLTAFERVYCYKYNSFVKYVGYNTNSPTTDYKKFKEAYNILKSRGVI
jgi:group I intron endonuclease